MRTPPAATLSSPVRASVAEAGHVDLNADLGETPEPPEGTADVLGSTVERLLGLVTTTHIACGFHAGGPRVMQRTVAAAVAAGVVVGAHPSYPDPEGFGRRPMDRSAQLVADDVARQLEALGSAALVEGAQLRSVKPHGALYHRLATDEECAVAVAEALRDHDPDLVLVVPAGAPTRATIAGCGVSVVAEGFCDRAYLADGSLAPRSQPGSVLVDPTEAAQRAIAMALGRGVEAIDGSAVVLDCDTLCVHGDAPGAVSIADAVRRALLAAGVSVAPYAA